MIQNALRSLHRHPIVPLFIAALFAACGSSPSDPPASGRRLSIYAGDAQQAWAGAGVAIDPAVIVTDDAGNGVSGVTVTFTVTNGSGRTRAGSTVTDGSGRAATWWLLGPEANTPQRLRAVTDDDASVEFRATALEPVAGSTRTGRNDYVEFIAGDLPVIVAAPHGGTLTPSEIPDRGVGTSARDTNTEELVRSIRQAFIDRVGAVPSIVINRLHRSKLDANREIVEAADGNEYAERAWYEWHAFIEAAALMATDAGPDGMALYLDIHGHGHTIPRIEIGYLLAAADLALPDDGLGQPSLIAKSSIRAVAADDGPRFVELVRGPTSLGELLAQRGYPAVPSASDPSPGADPYFTGGYNTARHGSRDGGSVSAIQIELNYAGIRDTDANRRQFAAALAAAVDAWFAAHLDSGLERQPLAGLAFDTDGRLWLLPSVADGAERTAEVRDSTGAVVFIAQWPGDIDPTFSGVLTDSIALAVRRDSLGVESIARLRWTGSS